MTPDGRKGKVFSVRLTDEERELVAKAVAVKLQRDGWRSFRYFGGSPPGVGTFIRDAAVAAAKRLLEAGTTASSAEPRKGRRR